MVNQHNLNLTLQFRKHAKLSHKLTGVKLKRPASISTNIIQSGLKIGEIKPIIYKNKLEKCHFTDLSCQFLSRRRDVATTDVRTRLSRRYHGNCLDFGENSVAALNIPTKRRVAMATTRAPRRPVSFQTKIKNRDADAISTTRRTRSALPTRLHYRKDSQIGTVTLKMERLCAVCKGEGKYKCPICLIF
jgi:hypothetical protein